MLIALSRVQCLDHHLDLSLVDNKEVPDAEDRMHRVDNLVKAARSSALLCESNDAERVALAVLDNGHNFGYKGDFLNVEVYKTC
jgi:hypothetical protein